MSDVKYSYYQSSKGYKVVGGNGDQLLRADGGVENKTDYSKKNMDEEWNGQKILKHSIPFIIKQTGVKSWLLHKSNWNGSLFWAMSTSNDGVDWNWANQIEFKDSGQIKAKGFEIVGYGDDYLNTSGGNNTHKRNLLWSRKYSFRADGAVHVIEPKGEVTTIVVTDGSDTNTEIHLPLTANNGQKVVLINASSAAWVMVTDPNITTSQKLYNASGGSSPAKAQMELTFVVDTANAEGVLTGSGHWYGSYVDEFVMI